MTSFTLPSFSQGIANLRPKVVYDWKYEKRAEALQSFVSFLPYWWFINREDPTHPLRFEARTMWRGQTELSELFDEEPWVFALKAGKLGFTQLETAFDAYRGLKLSNSRVHLFSMNQVSSKSLLGYVRYGLERLPDWFEVRIRADLAGGDTTEQLIVTVGPDVSDKRTWVSYAAGDNVSIDQTCIHAHVDELARMTHPEATWSAVQSTVSPIDGTCHIVTRGQGESDFLENLWDAASPGEAGSLVGRAHGVRTGKLVGYFAPFDYRGDRNELWRETEAATMTPQQLAWWAPADPTDAFAGDEMQTFVPIAWWDALQDDELQPLIPGDRTPLVVSLDAAVTGDSFAMLAVSRHPDPEKWADNVAVRGVNIWRPKDFPGGRIDFDYVERFLRCLCRGGCAGYVDDFGLLQQHPLTPDRRWLQPEICAACREERFVPRFNVVCVTYDPHELEQMAQRLERERVCWMNPFDQGEQRLMADKALYDLIVWRRLAHGGSSVLREHIDNAKSKVPKDDDKKLRLIKKSPARKIDGAVSLSMGAYECLRLNMPRNPQ